MKKICMVALAVLMAVTATGCGRRKDKNPEPIPTVTTEPTAPTTAAPTIIPEVPEIETNIPDPTVNGNSTDPMDPTDGTEQHPENSRGRIRDHHYGK